MTIRQKRLPFQALRYVHSTLSLGDSMSQEGSTEFESLLVPSLGTFNSPIPFLIGKCVRVCVAGF